MFSVNGKDPACLGLASHENSSAYTAYINTYRFSTFKLIYLIHLFIYNIFSKNFLLEQGLPQLLKD